MADNRYDKSFTKTERYYAYSPTFGRKRATAEQSVTQETAIAWAASLPGSVNLVHEEGPASKPLGTTVVWERNPKAVETVTLTDADGNVWTLPKSVFLAHAQQA